MPESTLANIISNTTNTTLYESLTSVEQDEEWGSLEQHPNGLYSDGFASCYAIIARNINYPRKVTLAHVSSIVDSDIDFFKEMLQAVTITGNDIAIELARSMQGYANGYEEALIHLDDGTIINRDEDALEPAAYFAEADQIYQQFFKTHFGMTPLIREMQAGMLVINHRGEIDYLEPHFDGEITIKELDIHQNKRSRSITSFFRTVDIEDLAEDIFSKKQKQTI